MAVSPLDNSDGVVDFTIKSEGSDISCRGKVRSIWVEQHLNRLARCTLVIEDGSNAEQDAPISNGDEFIPGNSISVSVSYDQQTSESLFEGMVVKHGIRADAQSQILTVECIDKAVAMTIGRHNANFATKSNAAIISALIGNYSGVSAGAMATTTATYSELVQFNATDWDFMVARADASGLLVKNVDNTISTVDPSASADSKLLLTYGKDMIAFSADVDARHLYKSVSTTGWDPAAQTIATQTADAQAIGKPAIYPQVIWPT
jgi:phage protein D